MIVFEQIKLFTQLYGFALVVDHIMSLLDQVGLRLKASALVDNLSGGQQQ